MPPEDTDNHPTTNQYRSLQELEDRMRSIRGELAILDGLQDPTEEDVNYQGTLITEHDGLDEKAVPLRRRMADLARIQQAARQPENREETRTTAERPGAGLTTFSRSNRDPFEDLDRVRGGFVSREDLRSRAASVIEQDATRYELTHDRAEAATQRIQAHPGVAKHILLTGTEEYRSAFRAYLEDPGWEKGPDRFRAINLTNASGGFLLPYILDPSIILTNNASANPFRRMSRIVQTTSNAWQGVNSAGVTAQFIAEATTAADMSPTIGQIQITPQKAVAWVLGSYEALDDTDFGQQLPGLLADARDRLESAYFTTGSGTSVPLGVVAALGTGSRVAPSTTGTAFVGTAAIPDVYNLQAALPPRFRNAAGAAFLGNIVTLNKVRAMDQYGGGSFWANLTSNTPAGLLGQPVYEGSDMNATMTGTSAASGTGSATLLFGDFSQFIIADRVGISMLYEPMVKGSGNAQLPSGQSGWFMFWRVGTGLSTTASMRYLTIS